MILRDKRVNENINSTKLGEVVEHPLRISGGAILDTTMGYTLIIEDSELVTMISLLKKVEERERRG